MPAAPSGRRRTVAPTAPLPASSAVLSGSAEEYLSWLAVERGRSPHTLAAYRRTPDGVVFGVNLAHAAPGVLGVGDAVMPAA